MSGNLGDNIEVLILSGGEGRRLREVVSDVPKPMAPIAGRPFLDYIVRNLIRQGLGHICFLAGYKAEVIEHYFSKEFADSQLRYSVESMPLGTGGAIALAMQSSRFNKFLVMNGDTYFNIRYQQFLQSWRPGTVKMALKVVDDPARYGQVMVDAEGLVLSFAEKNPLAIAGNDFAINAGIYLLEKSDVRLPVDQPTSFEKDVLPGLVQQQRLYAQTFKNEFIDIGIPDDFNRAQTLIPQWSEEI